MIVQEEVKYRDKTFIHTYSNLRYRIKQSGTGIIYDEALDLPEAGYTYEETSEPITAIDELSNDPYAVAGRLLLGEGV